MTQVQNPEEHDYGTQRGRKRVWEPNRDPSKGIRSRVRRSEDRGMVASQDLTRLQASGSAVIVAALHGIEQRASRISSPLQLMGSQIVPYASICI